MRASRRQIPQSARRPQVWARGWCGASLGMTAIPACPWPSRSPACSGCGSRSCSRTRRRRADPTEEVHRGLGCMPCIAGRVAHSPRATPCPARRQWRGGRSFPHGVGNGGGMEARQGAMRIFFRGTPLLSGAPRNPPSRLHLMRDPVNRPPRTNAAETGRPSRAPRLHEIAHQVFVKAGPGALFGRCRAG
jgi:hypothetical protein